MNTKLQWLAILSLLFLTACSTTSVEPKVDFTYTIHAAADINPDINGDPSSVLVRVFQLANTGNFQAARYEDLFSRQVTILGSEMLGVNEHLIDPATNKTFTVGISANTKFIGIAVGYRRVDLVTWKTLKALPEKSLLDTINIFGKKRHGHLSRAINGKCCV